MGAEHFDLRFLIHGRHFGRGKEVIDRAIDENRFHGKSEFHTPILLKSFVQKDLGEQKGEMTARGIAHQEDFIFL